MDNHETPPPNPPLPKLRILLFGVRGHRKKVRVLAYRETLVVDFITDKSFTMDQAALETLVAYKFNQASKSI